MPSKNYGPVLAKVRVGKGKLLDEQKYNAMVNAENFNVAISYLNNTDYWNYVSKFARTKPSTLDLERALNEYYRDELSKCIKYSPDDGKIFLNLLHDRELVLALENILCAKHYGVDFETFQRTFTREAFLAKRGLSYENLSPLLDSFLERSLASEIDSILSEPSLDPNLITLDIKFRFWRKLLEEAKRRRMQSILYKVVRSQVLKENILSILRLRKMSIPATIVKKYIIPFYSVEEEVFERLMSTEDLKTLTPYIEGLQGTIREFMEKVPELKVEELETAYNKIIAREAYKVFLAYPFQPDIAYGYMVLKRYEIEDVMNVLKSKALEVDIGSLKKVLILPTFF